MAKKARILVLSVMAVVALLLLIQLIPYGKNYSNPPIVREPSWDSAATRAIVKRACFDCHSNETVWPWYSRIAPVSWLVRFDVDEGREELNFSDWRSGAREAERPDKIRKEVSTGGMPPFMFRLAHPAAKLSDVEKSQLLDGLTAMSPRR